ncbi:hypothetical protein C8R44DRAFT_878903 [Mycena epipterygia]|nr:hypothetical protein C8R44DRAFT_878903 [Mycena epipterygia]
MFPLKAAPTRYTIWPPLPFHRVPCLHPRFQTSPACRAIPQSTKLPQNYPCRVALALALAQLPALLTPQKLHPHGWKPAFQGRSAQHYCLASPTPRFPEIPLTRAESIAPPPGYTCAPYPWVGPPGGTHHALPFAQRLNWRPSPAIDLTAGGIVRCCFFRYSPHCAPPSLSTPPHFHSPGLAAARALHRGDVCAPLRAPHLPPSRRLAPPPPVCAVRVAGSRSWWFRFMYLPCAAIFLPSPYNIICYFKISLVSVY